MNDLKNYETIRLICVDIQNDFCPGGSLAVNDGDKVVPVINRVARWVRERHGIVAFTADWHPEQTTHFDSWPVHCVAGTNGAEFHPGLEIKRYDALLRKGTGPNENAYSGFEARDVLGNTLDSLVHPRRSPLAILIGGLATDYCVKATVLDAIAKTRYDNETDVYVIGDAIVAVDLETGDENRAIERMKQAGALFVQSEDLLSGKILDVAR